MPPARTEVDVAGRRLENGQLVLDARLSGHDTFLTGTLLLEGQEVQVRILTFDDVTVLDPASPQELPPAGAVWSGVLRLPHGWRPPEIPDDLAKAAAEAGIDPGRWDAANARHLLTYLSEAREGPVRTQRIQVIITALRAEP